MRKKISLMLALLLMGAAVEAQTLAAVRAESEQKDVQGKASTAFEARQGRTIANGIEQVQRVETESHRGGAKTTGTPITTLPYSTGFEAEEDTGWVMQNGTNGWYIGEAVSHGGTQALYISSNGGSVCSYNGTVESHSYATRSITFAETVEIAFSYDWYANGDAYDYMRVFLAPEEETLVADRETDGLTDRSLPTGCIALDGGAGLNGQTTWTTMSGTTMVTAGTYNLVFYWYNDDQITRSPAPAIDNLSIVQVTCPAPTNLSYVAGTSNSLTFSWHNRANATTFAVSVGGQTATVNDTIYTAENLNPMTEYTISVRAICDGNDTGLAAIQTFRTECSAVQIPYTMDFDDNGVDCWNVMSYYTDNESETRLYSSATTSHSGNRCYRTMPGYNDQPVYIVSPRIEGLATKKVNFWARSSLIGAAWVRIKVGTMTNPYDTTTFECQYTVERLATGNTWHQFEALLYGDTRQSEFMAIRVGVSSGYGYPVFIDDITISEMPNCVPPRSVRLRDISDDGAEVVVDDPVDRMSYRIVVRQDTSEVFNEVVNDTVYRITGMQPTTNYTVYISSVCDGEESSSISIEMNTTCPEIIDFPWTEQFSDSEALKCWTILDLDEREQDNWTRNSNGYATAAYNFSRDADDWLITPGLSLSDELAGVYIKWDARGHTYNDTYHSHLTVLLSTGGVDPEEFMDTLWSGTLTDEWEQFSALLDDYLGGTVYIAFVHDCYNDNGVDVDNVSVRSELSPIASLEGPLSAEVGIAEQWTGHLAEGSEQGLAYGWISTMEAAEQATMVIDQNVITITYNTVGTDTLKFIVYNNYGSDTTTMTIAVQQCIVPTLPFVEEFTSNASLSCWTIYDFDDREEDNWYRTGLGEMSTSYNYDRNADDWLVTPPVVIPNNGEVANLKWKARGMLGADQEQAHLTVRLSTAGTSTDTASFNHIVWRGYLNSVDERFSSSLAAYAGDTVRVAFIHDSRDDRGATVDSVAISIAAEPTVSIIGPSYARTGESARFEATLMEGSVTNLTYTWSSAMQQNGQAVLNVSGGSVSVVYNATGNDVITLVGTNIFGSDTVQKTIEVVTCTPIATLPWMEDFDDATLTATEYNHSGRLPNYCWDGVSNGLDENYIPHITTGGEFNYQYSPDSANSVVMAAGPDSLYGTRKYLVLPRFAEELRGLNMDFWYRYESNNYGTLTVGYTTTNDADSSFVAVRTVPANIEGARDTVSFETVSATNARIAFRWENTENTWFTVSVDNIRVESSGRLGVDEMTAEEANVKIYPNPATQRLTVEAEGMEQMQMVDLNGRTVLQRAMNNSRTTVDVSTLSRGTYFVHLTGREGKVVRKVIVR